MDGRRSRGRVWRLLLGLLLGCAIAIPGWRRRALTADGAAAATLVGAATFGFGGLPASLGLIAFFLTGSALSRRKAADGELSSARGSRRDAVQVLANGGIAALALTAGELGLPRMGGAALGSLAAAAADTWASEVGVRSPWPPRSIVTGQVVRPGTSGGVTLLGWGAAAAGALTVGTAWTVAARRRPSLVLCALLAGLCGSLADSLAGATIQAAYFCETCGATFEAAGEHCGWPRRLVRGRAWVTNDAVNVIGTAVGALVGTFVTSSE
ncbi:MAG: DUF92 domain-containing protein [Chloroflexota bacterium]